jgi:hypothetical protein
MVFVVQAELFIGTWLLVRVYPQAAWWAVVGLFAGFAGFSLYRGLAGYESCGCFGAIGVSPWWTFALDVVILGLLVFIRPASVKGGLVKWSAPVIAEPSIGTRPSVRSTKVLVGAIAYVAMSVTALVLMVSRPSPAAPGEMVGGSGLVLLEPEEWVGRELPIKDWLSPQVDVSEGDWVIVIVHHDCPTCLGAIPKYETMVRGNELGDSVRLLFVEAPPYGELPLVEGGAIVRARLSSEREWFVQTPIEIRVRNGIVQSASVELPLIGGPR